MAALLHHKSTAPIKLLLIGHSGSGKTGSLASLAAAGYNLRVIDLDKGIDILANLLTDPNSPYYKRDPEAASRVEYVQLSDTIRTANGAFVPTAAGWQKMTTLLMNWKDGDVDLGPVSKWTSNDVLVIDSLSGLAKMALNYHLTINGAIGKNRTQNEARRDIGATQNYIRDLLELLSADSIKCHIVVIAHVTMVTEAGGAPKIEEGKFDSVPTGFPAAIGRALSPQIPRYFNTMLVAKAVMQGIRPKHMIFTQSQNLGDQIVSAKTAAPLRVKAEYPLEFGLAEIFADLRG